jgi:hypothetical protein
VRLPFNRQQRPRNTTTHAETRTRTAKRHTQTPPPCLRTLTCKPFLSFLTVGCTQNWISPTRFPNQNQPSAYRHNLHLHYISNLKLVTVSGN